MRTVSLLLVLPLFVATAEAGVVLQVSSHGLASGKKTAHVVYYAQAGMMRIDMLDDGGNVNRTDLVRDGMIWEIDPRKRTYTRIDQATVKAFFGGQQGQMDAMLAKMPPERRALMQAQIAKMQHPDQETFTDTGRTETSGQYSCRMWQEQHAGRPFAEYCVVPASSLPGGAELAPAIHTDKFAIPQGFTEKPLGKPQND